MENPHEANSLAGELQGGLDGILALPKRLDRYHKARSRTLLMQNYIQSLRTDSATQKLASQLKQCGSYLVFNDYYRINKLRLAKTTTCKKHLLCPFCAIRRGARALSNYLPKYHELMARNPNLKGYVVTLTVKDGEDLHERMQHLMQCHRRYGSQRRDHLKAPNKNRHVEYAKAVAGIGSYETKIGSGSGLHHPHLHMIWLCHEAPDARKLSEEWHALTGDSFIVDVTPFHDSQPPEQAFIEVCKYAVKFSEMPLEQNFHAFEVLSRQRLFFSFGEFRGLDVNDSLTDDLIENEPYNELFYRHTPSGYSFVSSSHHDVQLPDSETLEEFGCETEESSQIYSSSRLAVGDLLGLDDPPHKYAYAWVRGWPYLPLTHVDKLRHFSHQRFLPISKSLLE